MNKGQTDWPKDEAKKFKNRIKKLLVNLKKPAPKEQLKWKVFFRF